MLDAMATRGVPGMGQRMRARREALKLSQADVAKAVGGKTSLEQIGHYEHERRSPGAQMIVDLARVLQCSTDYLLGVPLTVPPALQALGTKTPAPAKVEGMPTLEEAQAHARRKGQRYIIYDGHPYRLRPDGWEPV